MPAVTLLSSGVIVAFAASKVRADAGGIREKPTRERVAERRPFALHNSLRRGATLISGRKAP